MSVAKHETQADSVGVCEERLVVRTGPPYPSREQGDPVLGTLFEEALVYAAVAHRHHRRKGERSPT
jgi:hypothetical protein